MRPTLHLQVIHYLIKTFQLWGNIYFMHPMQDDKLSSLEKEHLIESLMRGNCNFEECRKQITHILSNKQFSADKQRLMEHIPNAIDLPVTILKDIWIEVVVSDFEEEFWSSLNTEVYFRHLNVLNLKEDLFQGSSLLEQIRERKKTIIYETEARKMRRTFQVWDI